MTHLSCLLKAFILFLHSISRTIYLIQQTPPSQQQQKHHFLSLNNSTRFTHSSWNNMEEIPRKHEDDDNKKNNNKKTLPVAFNIGAGGLGIGGIVLVGGALITATIVSALAFKNRRQSRRSSSDNMKKKKNRSPSLDAPSSDEVTNKTENIQSLTLDKKHEMDIKDQENTCLERDDGGGNENDEQVDANLSVSDEAVMSVEEYEAIEDGEDHQETVFMEETSAAVMEDGCVNQVKVEDSLHDEIVLDNCEGLE
ncbi:uncharacterized protein LOC143564201 [Bidens hawaiensis]|uniref:uncharacterized protein LOC143564201 n=1 Tax=Bidens hawaiensis TaxID=980011 RepID=UPI004049F692